MSFNNRGSRSEVFCKKGVLKNFESFTGKLSFLTAALATLLKKNNIKENNIKHKTSRVVSMLLSQLGDAQQLKMRFSNDAKCPLSRQLL